MKKFIQPPVTTTSEQRRKFAALVVLSGIVVVLFWALLFPWSYRPDENAPAGPKEFFQVIGNEISTGAQMIPETMNAAKGNSTPSSEATIK